MSFRFIFGLMAFCAFSASGASLDFSRYHSQADIAKYLRQLSTDYPALVHFYVLGQSDEKREIAYISLTKGNEQLPGIYFNGTHHGDEWSATEGILGLIDYLITNKDDATVSALLSKYVFYLQPLINPDGHYRRTREDVNGVDPNRDYAYPGGSASEAFQTEIIPITRKLIDGHKMRAAAAYHSGIEEVIWPWCYTGSATPDKNLFYTLAKKAAQAMNFTRYIQSYDDYATEGEFIDYTYMTQKTLALTFEVSEEKTPSESQLPAIVKRSVAGAMAFILGVRDADNGTLKVQTAPLSMADSAASSLWQTLGFKLE